MKDDNKMEIGWKPSESKVKVAKKYYNWLID